MGYFFETLLYDFLHLGFQLEVILMKNDAVTMYNLLKL